MTLQLPSELPVSNALILLHRSNGDAMQICLGEMTNPSDILKIGSNDSKKVLKIRKKYGKYVIVHGKYIYNFCHINKVTYQQALFNELEQSNKINADVVIHQGKNVNKYEPAKARQVYADNIRMVITKMQAASLTNRIILENSSHQGTEIGYTLTELHQIWELFTPEERQYLGFCIDTCHIFVAGELDVRQPMDVAEWFKRFDRLIGKEHLKVVHLNDSSPDFNARNDHHAGLGKGHIGLVGLKSVVDICVKWSVPMIAETPSQSMEEEIVIVQDWLC
jgi:deoxyribonuclease-4